jgi:hypothetical protein
MDEGWDLKGNEKSYADLLHQMGREDVGKKAAAKALPIPNFP